MLRIISKNAKGGLEMKLLLIGPQGSGKGTQGKKLEENYGWPSISAGDLIRARMKTDEVFREKYSEVNKGALIPDLEIAKMIQERIKQNDCKNGYILDGFPRTLGQAKILDEMVKIDYAILIDVPDKVCVERLSKRRMCTKCNKIYGVNEAPPENGKCPCGGKIYQRKDDYPEAIQKRLSLYHEKTEPLIDFYEKQNKLVRINGVGSVKEVFKRIKESLGLE